MVNVLYTKENEVFTNNIFFISSDYSEIVKIKKIMSYVDPIQSKVNLINLFAKPFMKKFSVFTDENYFINFSFEFSAVEETVLYNDVVKVLTDIINHRKNNNFYALKYFNDFNEQLNSGKFDNISFGKLFLESAPNLGGN